MKKNLSFLFIIFSFCIAPAIVFGQSACTDQTQGKSRSQLEQELAACEAEMKEWQAELDKARQQSAGFQTDVSALTAKINVAQSNIKQKNIAITNLNADISQKVSQINTLENRIDNDLSHIADLIRKTKRIDSYSMAEAVFSEKDLSDFFVDVDSYASTRLALIGLVDNLRGTKVETEAQRIELAKKRDAEAAARAQIEANKRQIEADQKEKQRLLAISKSNEKTYAQEVADRQAKATQIRATLFPLANTDTAIPFSTALQYAQAASAKTGIRPAFLLAIIQQESSLGANTGSCVITDLSSGQTKSIKSNTVFSNGIHPTRDLPPLQSILKSIGRNPLDTRVSCPLGVGYGGAMGPAQFIPSTWNIIKGRLSNLLGKDNPDPWIPADAFMASAILLSDNMGSLGDQYTDERTAACRYYSGQTCYVGSRAGRGLSYGNSVMEKAKRIQQDIDFLRDN